MTDNQQAIRDRILVAALAHVAFDGWTQRTLKAGVKDAGMSPDMALRAFAGGIPDLVDHWADWADRRMLEKTGGLAIRLSSREVETVAQGQGAHGWSQGRPSTSGDGQSRECGWRPPRSGSSS